ncbi:hypothetical protein Ahy_B02g057179 isoform C [Arachis hypogaea]|uniref:Nucleoporin NSP1-like C-terminal domain-containing protein n=1 Tax=Arachis hypogaea TaxID=3818 RepID=A0A445AB62_ARAHY|nr:hypothetical protein Ahy_B02g057179 isoform C [Arachis hypogaea]
MKRSKGCWRKKWLPFWSMTERETEGLWKKKIGDLKVVAYAKKLVIESIQNHQTEEPKKDISKEKQSKAFGIEKRANLFLHHHRSWTFCSLSLSTSHRISHSLLLLQLRDSIIKEWNTELQERTGKFRKQANAIAERDRRILKNRDVLLRLEIEAAKVVETQSNMERQLELIETHQQEVDKALQSMEEDEAASTRECMSSLN